MVDRATILETACIHVTNTDEEDRLDNTRSRVSGEIKREPRDVDRINLFPINQRALWKTQGAIATVEPADIYFRDIKPVSLSLRASLTSPIRSQTAQRR